MEKSSFFNAVINGGVPDRSYLAEDFARYFSTFIGNGVFPNPSDQLQVIAVDNNMNIRIKKGCAWINGYMYENTDEYILKLNPADGVLDRIDRVVLRLDFLERKIKAVVKQGDWNSNPISKELQRDENAYEIALADLKVKHGIIGINAGDITDLRLNKNLCGIVHGTIEQVDTTEIFNQYTRYLNAKLNSNEFSDWLDKLKNKLDPNSDLAAQLQLQIDSLQLTAENVTLNDNNFKSKNVKGALDELFTFADNGKKGIVDVIGNPLNANDSFSTIKNKTQDIKNTLVDNLKNKGIYKSYNDNLKILVDSISLIDSVKVQHGICNGKNKVYTVPVDHVNPSNCIVISRFDGYNLAIDPYATIFENSLCLQNYTKEWIIIESPKFNVARGHFKETILDDRKRTLTVNFNTMKNKPFMVFGTEYELENNRAANRISLSDVHITNDSFYIETIGGIKTIYASYWNAISIN